MRPLTDFRDTHVSLAHGNGGARMRELIEDVFSRLLINPFLDTTSDAVSLPTPIGEELVVTTDGYTVKPLEFPGGDIGSLAVHGTVNDLAVVGAIPRFLTLSVFLEEGLDIALLRRVAASLAQAASKCDVSVVAGDTKVVGRGECDGIYLSTTGIGFKSSEHRFALDRIKAGDKILVSGSVGDHGAAVMLARKEFGFRGDLKSDSASILAEASALAGVAGVRFMRDPTRGGLATVAHEIARATGFSVHLTEGQIPIDEAVHSICELLGFDPLYLACEGRIVAVVAPEACEPALSALRRIAPAAALIGEIRVDGFQVTLQTSFGGLRSLDELEDDPLPRIC